MYFRYFQCFMSEIVNMKNGNSSEFQFHAFNFLSIENNISCVTSLKLLSNAFMELEYKQDRKISMHFE